MNKLKGFGYVEGIVAVVALLGGGGWVANIVKLAGSSFDPITGMALLRVVGIFVPPLGAVLGYL